MTEWMTVVHVESQDEDGQSFIVGGVLPVATNPELMALTP